MRSLSSIYSKYICSLVKLHALLGKPRAARNAVITLLAIHTVLLAYSAYVHSPTLNEPGHLVAGLSHWKFGRFELYRVNPPLVRMVAALPVMAAGYEEDWSRFHEGPGVRPVFGMGEDFVAANSVRSYFLFMIARWACIPFSWIGAITCFLWARDLYDRSAGVMACTLWCFSPNILAHAALITADVGGTALGVAACYTFWRWLKNPTWMQAALTGVVLGLAELAKTTLILFYPLWPLLWIIYRWPNRRRMSLQDWFCEAGMLALRMIIGIYVLNFGYGFEGTGKQLNEFHFVSNLFTEQSANTEEVLSSSSTLMPDDPSTNRFADSWLSTMPVPFPENYLKGIDIQRRDFENYGRPFYLGGKWRNHGWWYYYVYASAIKIPMGTWLLVLIVMGYRLVVHQHTIQLRDECILILPGVLLFVVVSANTGINEHMRYVLPCFPFVFIWLGQFTEWIAYTAKKVKNHPSKSHDYRLRVLTVCILLIWSIGSSMWIFPHSLSYFNELVGGPMHGSEHLISSNIDWGQDLRYFEWWTESNPAIRPLYLAYHGQIEPNHLGLNDLADWQDEYVTDISSLQKTNSSRRLLNGVEKASPRYLAISKNLLRGYPTPARGAQSRTRVLTHREISCFDTYKSIGSAGYSILIFRDFN